MVAMTTTLISSMGSRVVLPATGVLMNNGVMWFDPRPGQPNSIGPGKRPLTNMFPLILRDGAAPVIAAGASGGRRIMAAVLQLLWFVTDFGMTRLRSHQDTRIGGTPAYMAPEAYQGNFPPRSDVFALGVMLYLAVEGRGPFPSATNRDQLLVAVTAGAVAPPQRTGQLGDPLMRMLHPDPALRPAAAAVADQLGQLAAGAGAGSLLEHKEAMGQVLRVVETLPKNQREVIYLKFQCDLSYKEISDITRLSVSNVGFLIHTAIKALRKEMLTESAKRRIQ